MRKARDFNGRATPCQMEDGGGRCPNTLRSPCGIRAQVALESKGPSGLGRPSIVFQLPQVQVNANRNKGTSHRA